MTIWSQLSAVGGIPYQDDTCWECPRQKSMDILKAYRVDDRWPFSLYELSYQNGKTAPDRIFVPAGAALGAKLETLVHIVGPWRLWRGVPFVVPFGGAFDPIWDMAGHVVTHRRSRTSQHQYRPDHDEHPRKAGGSAIDIAIKGGLEQRDVDYLHGLRLPDGRKVSVGQYWRDGFFHVDIRQGRPWRSVVQPRPEVA